MAISNLSQASGYTPVENEVTQPTVVPSGGSSPPVSTGEGSFTQPISSPIPGEVVRPQAASLSPDGGSPVTAQVGEVLSAALATVETTQDTPDGLTVDPPAQGEAPLVPTPQPIFEAPQAPVNLPAPPALPGAEPKPAPTYTSVLSPIVATRPDSSVTIAPEPQPVVTPKGNYTSVLPKMAGVVPTGPLADVKGPRTLTAAVDAYRQNETRVSPAADLSAIVSRYQQNPAAYAITKADITDESATVGKSWAFGNMTNPNALVIHHTAGRGTADGVIQTFRERGYPAHFIIDREGTLVQVLGDMQKGKHAGSAVPGIDNSNSWGVEIIAKNDADITPQQAETAVKLEQYLATNYGLNPNRVFGHGELTGRKEASEGQTVTSLLRQLTGVNKAWTPFGG